jgi:hypothetical protein
MQNYFHFLHYNILNGFENDNRRIERFCGYIAHQSFDFLSIN